MDAPKVLYVRVLDAAFKSARFVVSDQLEDFRDSGPVATYRLERVGHLNVQRNLSKPAVGVAGAASPAPVKKKRK
ncbi:MAG TPA: hypothetical protein VGR34_06390 [Candidatus Dormibacteraeota bacterium]|nr:hypothetical protein [Candidatus Dormibacteraeota bacterium]